MNPVHFLLERESKELLAYRDFLETVFTTVDVEPGAEVAGADLARLVERAEILKAEKRRIYLREAAKLGVRLVLAQERQRNAERAAGKGKPAPAARRAPPPRYKPTLAGPSLQGRRDKTADEIRAMREARSGGNSNASRGAI